MHMPWYRAVRHLSTRRLPSAPLSRHSGSHEVSGMTPVALTHHIAPIAGPVAEMHDHRICRLSRCSR